MADHTHNKNCPCVASEKAIFFKENNITVDPSEYFLLYVSLGSGDETIIVHKLTTIDLIKNAILNAFFCPCCTVDIELNPVEELYDGVHIEVIRGKEKDGEWSTQLFKEN